MHWEDKQKTSVITRMKMIFGVIRSIAFTLVSCDMAVLVVLEVPRTTGEYYSNIETILTIDKYENVALMDPINNSSTATISQLTKVLYSSQ